MGDLLDKALKTVEELEAKKYWDLAEQISDSHQYFYEQICGDDEGVKEVTAAILTLALIVGDALRKK